MINVTDNPDIHSANSLATDSGWRASLQLGFVKKHKTVASHVKHYGPLRIQRAFYPENNHPGNNNTCHVYLLHPPGGVVGGDRLEIDIEAHENTDTLITTPAANKFYRSKQIYAKQEQHIRVGSHANFEWLPQETIVYDGAYVKSTTRIDMEESASFIGWDIVCLGRPAANEKFTHGHFKQHIELWHKQRPLLIDRSNFTGGSEALQAQWGMADYPVNGILIATSDNKNLVEKIRKQQPFKHCHFSVTCMNSLIVCRYLGRHIDEAKSLFTHAWTLLRPSVSARQAVIPRIWNT